MSFKMNRFWTPVSASMKNNVIDIEDGLFTVKIDAPFDNLVFEKQNIPFSNSHVQCMLSNDRYFLVIRFDGSISLYWKENCVQVYHKKPLLKEPIFDLNMYTPIGVSGGIFDFGYVDSLIPTRLMYIKNRLFMFSNVPCVACVDVEYNQYYVHYCRTNHTLNLPLLHKTENGIIYDKVTKDMIKAKHIYGLTPSINVTPEHILKGDI